MQTDTKEEVSEARVYKPRVNMRLCIGCGDCVVACPINKTAEGSVDDSKTILSVKNGILEIDNIHLCDGCGLCIEACLPKAISIQFPVQEAE